MLTRTRKILAMVSGTRSDTSNNEPRTYTTQGSVGEDHQDSGSTDLRQLDGMPAYETTKGTSRSEQEKAIQGYTQIIENHSFEKEEHTKPTAYVSPLNKDDLKEVRDNNLNSFESDHEAFSDTGSEYIPSEGSDTSIVSNTTAGNSPVIPYFPQLLPSDDDSPKTLNDARVSDCRKPTKREKSRKRSRITPSSSSRNSNIEYNDTTDEPDVEENSGIVIQVARRDDVGKRIRNKKHSCYFCHKLLQNMSRHYEIRHGNETEVARILAMAKNSKQRRDEFRSLNRAGDFYHNIEVLTTKSGELVLARRPTPLESIGVTYMDYGPCPKCLGFLLKKHLWHHQKYGCVKSKSSQDNDEDRKSSKFFQIESTTILNGVLSSQIPADFKTNIVSKLRCDEIGNISQNDELIMRFGAFLYEKYGNAQNELIRQSMRQMGRLLLQLRIVDPDIKQLSDSLYPEKFDVIIQATKKLCVNMAKGVMQRSEFGIPSLALKIGYALKKCIGIERGKALRIGNIKKEKNLVAFEKLLELEWNVKISSNALSTLYRRKMNSAELLPLTNDLVKLSKFLDEETQRTIDEINSKCCLRTWSRLASLILVRIILFNKRRSGEAARMTVEQYCSRPDWTEAGTEAIRESLTSFEKELAKKLVIVEIIGKRGRKVPIILTPGMKTAIDILIRTRDACDISKENPFLFALGGGSSSFMRGHDVVKRWCQEADLESPNLITGTKLRKYVATVCQVFNLTENQTDWLAKHLGHDIRVHRDFYRLHDNAVELAKVSRLLLVLDQGGVKRFAGKSLEDITVDDLPHIETGGTDNEEDDFEDECSSPVRQGKDLPHIETGEKDNEEDDFEDECSSSVRKAKGKSPPKVVNHKIVRAKRIKKKYWTEAEKEAVLKAFKTEVKFGILPGKEKCTRFIEEHKHIFSNRKWTDIKFYIRNHLTKIESLKRQKT